MPNYIGSSTNLLAPKFRTAGYLGITDDKAFAWWNSISEGILEFCKEA